MNNLHVNGPGVVMIFCSPWYHFVVLYGRLVVVVGNLQIVNFYIECIKIDQKDQDSEF